MTMAFMWYRLNIFTAFDGFLTFLFLDATREVKDEPHERKTAVVYSRDVIIIRERIYHFFTQIFFLW